MYDLDALFADSCTMQLLIPIGFMNYIEVGRVEWEEWKYLTEKELGIKFSQ